MKVQYLSQVNYNSRAKFLSKTQQNPQSDETTSSDLTSQSNITFGIAMKVPTKGFKQTVGIFFAGLGLGLYTLAKQMDPEIYNRMYEKYGIPYSPTKEQKDYWLMRHFHPDKVNYYIREGMSQEDIRKTIHISEQIKHMSNKEFKERKQKIIERGALDCGIIPEQITKNNILLLEKILDNKGLLTDARINQGLPDYCSCLCVDDTYGACATRMNTIDWFIKEDWAVYKDWFPDIINSVRSSKQLQLKKDWVDWLKKEDLFNQHIGQGKSLMRSIMHIDTEEKLEDARILFAALKPSIIKGDLPQNLDPGTILYNTKSIIDYTDTKPMACLITLLTTLNLLKTGYVQKNMQYLTSQCYKVELIPGVIARCVKEAQKEQ